MVQRPHLAFAGSFSGPHETRSAPAPPISSLLAPMQLDALTVADGQAFLDRIATERNLPEYLAPHLVELYRAMP